MHRLTHTAQVPDQQGNDQGLISGYPCGTGDALPLTICDWKDASVWKYLNIHSSEHLLPFFVTSYSDSAWNWIVSNSLECSILIFCSWFACGSPDLTLLQHLLFFFHINLILFIMIKFRFFIFLLLVLCVHEILFQSVFLI